MGAYVYYSYEEFGRGYIGARIGSPEGDAYLGSYRDQSFNPTQKIILAEFETFEEALECEILLHKFFEVAKNPHFANKARQTSTGWTTAGSDGHWKGKTLTDEHKDNVRKARLGVSTITEQGRKSIREYMTEREVSRETGEKIRRLKRTPVSFINEDGGLFFDAKRDAAEYFGVTASAISHALKAGKWRGYFVG